MTRSRGVIDRARDSRGAVLVLVALALPMLIGMGGIGVDVGNWLAHKRHLQVQADAGAFAGASAFNACLGVGGNSLAMRREAAKYASVNLAGSGFSAPGKNPQIGGTAIGQLLGLVNSKVYDRQSTPNDDTDPRDPCVAGMLDVKLTEKDLPWILRALNVDYINAQARIEVRKKLTAAGSLPIGVPEVGPKRATAIFVNEATGAEISSTTLTRTGVSGGLATWSNVDAPVAVPITTSKIGVRIVLSGSALTTTCGDPLVACYGAGTSSAIVAGSPGLVHIRGWSAATAGSLAAPRVRGAELFGAGCEDGYFTTIAPSYPCKVNVGAVVDFGGTVPAASRVLVKKTGANDSTAVELTAPATATASWTGGAISIAASSGATSVDLLWQTGCNTDRTKPCNAPLTDLGTVQRAFAGDESLTQSGPIKLIRVSESGVPGANSFESCASGCTHNLVVTLGLKANLELALPGDPPVSLKLAGGGSQNQSLQCGSGTNLRDDLTNGCRQKYTVNGGQACPDKTALWASAQPWNCIVIATGAQVGQVRQGISARILGTSTTCSAPNNWPRTPVGDPRIVDVILTSFGAFNGSGGATIPVTGFATFYVTGWDNGACQGAGDDPAGQGAIVGHFIKYIDTLNPGGGSNEMCDFTSFGSCVAVLTR